MSNVLGFSTSFIYDNAENGHKHFEFPTVGESRNSHKQEGIGEGEEHG
jgi:hypothetical protein